MNEPRQLLEQIHLCFSSNEIDVRTLSPLKLAYLGDAVFEIIVRTLVIESTGGPVKKLHKKSSELVNAHTQAILSAAMQDSLTKEEQAAFRHGRNAKPSSVAKHADIHDYRNATGLESLFGYLYLTGHTDRAVELLKTAMDKANIRIEAAALR